MGKDLHYSIRPYIERVLLSHSMVRAFQPVELDNYYAYKVQRNKGYRDVLVVLSDAYTFNHYSYLDRPSVLRDGGFILIARPEASVTERNEVADKISVGRIGRLMGALHKDDFWNYEPPVKEKE